MRKYLIRILGGFPDVESCIDYVIKQEDLIPANQLLSASTKHLLNTVSADEILHQNKTVWVFEGKPLSPDQVTGLKTQARVFQNSQLFKVLDMKIKYLSNKRLHEASNLAELLVAKAILYQWDIVKDALKKELAS